MPCDKGPDGNPGLIVTLSNRPRYVEGDAQVWRKHLDLDGVMVGMYAGDAWSPSDFARAEQLPGQDVDGWHIPIAIEYGVTEGHVSYQSALPTQWSYGGAGVWQRGTVASQYVQMWSLVEQATENLDFQIGKTDSLVFSMHPELFMVAITANYRVGPMELDMLGVASQRFYGRVLAVILDLDRYGQMMQKKSESEAGGSSADGA